MAAHVRHLYKHSSITRPNRLFTDTRSNSNLISKQLHCLNRVFSSAVFTNRKEHPHCVVRQSSVCCGCFHQQNIKGRRHFAFVENTHITVSKRNFSAETYSKYFSPDAAPIGYAQTILEQIHSVTGLPWWASIALSTVALRGIITFPLTVYSMKVMARVELLQPEIAKLSQELRREVKVAVKKFDWDEKYARSKYNSTMKRLIQDLYVRENCHPVKSSLVLWFQIPMWVCLSFALRNMSGAVPALAAEQAPVLCPEMRTEGTLWFPDLTAPDSTWILPVMLGLSNLLNIEMNALTTKRVGKFQKAVVYLLRALSLVMVPVGSIMPSCLCYYWVCSSLFSLGQNIVFKVPSVRRLVRLPKTPSESATPFQDMFIAAKSKYTFKRNQKES